jgi:hypothetical protein
MTTIIYSLVEGIVASLIAVALLEIYRACRRFLSHRAIRRILGKSERIGIVAPSYPQTRNPLSAGLLTTDNAFALAEIIDACRKIGAESVLSPVARIADNFPDDLVLLGGHIANDLTCRFLKDYCTGFEIHGAMEDSSERPANDIFYSCAGRDFVDTDQDAWAFIAKLSSGLTRSPRTVVMIWGRSSFGTAAAAHFLTNRAHLLNANRAQSLFCVLRMSRQLNYQSLPAEIIDLTDRVFRISDS